MANSPRILVARFLRANNYEETLDAFIKEADLSQDAGILSKGDLTVENILEEKRLYDVSTSFEKLGVDDPPLGWTLPAPSVPALVDSLTSESNVIHVAVEKVTIPEENETCKSSIVVTTADRQIHLLETKTPYPLRKWSAPLNDSPVLSSVMIGPDGRYLITASMSGRVAIIDCWNGNTIEERRDHKKYCVKVAKYEDATGLWLATAGWDSRVFIYRSDMIDSVNGPELGSPVASIETPTNPETVLFVRHPESSSPVLVLTRRDSTSLHYYALPSSQSMRYEFTPNLMGQQNLAPHSNAWIAFSPSAVEVSPTDASILAVATSAVPHMKLIIVRLLLPPVMPQHSAITPTNLTQASQARAAIAIQDREAAAILIHSNTMSPQTQYSTPALAWRPDGSGIWVNGDDGAIRGIEASSGKIMATLQGAHEAGVKVRCISSGLVEGHGDEKVEMIVSGGFDRRLVIWWIAG